MSYSTQSSKINQQGDNYLSGGVRDPSQIATDGVRGQIFIQVARDSGQPVGLWQKLDNGITTNWTKINQNGSGISPGPGGPNIFSLDLNGTNEYVNVPTNVNFANLGSAFSVACMIKTAKTNNSNSLMSIWGSLANFQTFNLLLENDGRPKLEVRSSSTNSIYKTSQNGVTQVNDGQWHMVGATFDSGQLRIYVDGVQERNEFTNQVTFVRQTSEPLNLGGRNQGGGLYTGLIDNCALFTEALTPADMLDFFNKNGDGIETGAYFSSCIGYWRFNVNNNLPEIKDSSLLQYDGIGVNLDPTNFSTDIP